MKNTFAMECSIDEPRLTEQTTLSLFESLPPELHKTIFDSIEFMEDLILLREYSKTLDQIIKNYIKQSPWKLVLKDFYNSFRFIDPKKFILLWDTFKPEGNSISFLYTMPINDANYYMLEGNNHLCSYHKHDFLLECDMCQSMVKKINKILFTQKHIHSIHINIELLRKYFRNKMEQFNNKYVLYDYYIVSLKQFHNLQALCISDFTIHNGIFRMLRGLKLQSLDLRNNNVICEQDYKYRFPPEELFFNLAQEIFDNISHISTLVSLNLENFFLLVSINQTMPQIPSDYIRLLMNLKKLRCLGLKTSLDVPYPTDIQNWIDNMKSPTACTICSLWWKNGVDLLKNKPDLYFKHDSDYLIQEEPENFKLIVSENF